MDGVATGSNSNSITPTIDGTYYVEVSNTNGCTEASAPFYFYGLEVDAGTNTFVCLGESINLSANILRGSDSLSLYWTNDSIQGNSFSFAPTTDTLIYLYAEDHLTGKHAYDSIVVLVENVATPNIWLSNDTLYTDNLPGLSYEWIYIILPLAGENEHYTVPTEDGTYYVRVTNLFGCEALSSAFTVNYNSINNFLDDVEVVIIPNPNSGVFSLQVTGLKDMQANIIVTDLLGRLVYEDNVLLTSNFTKQFNFDYLPAETYVIKISTSQGEISRLFLIR